MPHVCVDARLYQAAGIGTYLKAAIASLAGRGRYQLSLICRKKDKERLAPYSCSLIEMDVPIYSAREQLRYRAHIPPCDLFWSPHFNVPLMPIRAKKRLATVCDVYHLAHFSSLSFLQKVYAKVMYNAAFLLSDQVTTISEFSKQEITRFSSCKPKNIVVVPPGFDHFPSQTVAKPTQNYLLYVGNLKPHKNLVRLVRAYDLLRPSERLYVVGKKEGLITGDTELFREVEKNPFLKRNVHFTGQVSEERLKELYAEAKLFVFPSTYEGFGYPPLEAMAYGCPVVASQAASIPEVCQDAVEYVDPLSVESIASGIGRVLSDQERREELSHKGKALFEKKKEQKNLIGDLIDACCSYP